MDCSLKFIFLFTLLSLINLSVSDPRATEAALICSNKTAASSDRQVYVANFLAAMDSVTPLVSRTKFGAVINGTGNNTVYAYGECLKDLSQTDCNLCFAQCKTQILRCLPFQRLITGGRLYYDGCFLRYDYYNFFNESMSSVDRTICGNSSFVGDQRLFKENVGKLMRDLKVGGIKNDGFLTGVVGNGSFSVYGLAQCWEFVNGSGCQRCISDAVMKIGSCFGKEEGRVLNAGCYVRYSTQKFFNNSASDTPAARNGGGSNRLAVILATTLGISAFLLFVSAVSFFVRKKVLKQQREKQQLGASIRTVNKSKLNISYETLEKAANYYNSSNKLGQGGSGSVYKGILPDGRVVAIKRLFFNTRQWVDHFFNEVNLISGIHHKNLVQLLGCSITGPESLLVYEYVPNHSLSDYIFDTKNLQPLTWRQRYKIVLGTAEGLAYLHEESKLRIIHRDIKLSNVLLDEDFTAKIADFGLARLFPEDKSHISTAIAGTLGYMAPEYIVRGKLTEKADVYSFGVLVIEVVCGKKNNYVFKNTNSLLQQLWNLYGMGKSCEAVDPLLEGKFNEEEASKLLQVGLLCVQASAELRPAMSSVVKMLTENHEIPQPTQPPFLNSGSSEFSPFNLQGKRFYGQPSSSTLSSGNKLTESWVEPR
ncbi:Cysteine-rich receptor-like protein kinase 3 [Capsicum annuum]|nr:Cysteine-rich receptor-like protein kinase 3 [Capsicum annuum]